MHPDKFDRHRGRHRGIAIGIEKAGIKKGATGMEENAEIRNFKLKLYKL